MCQTGAIAQKLSKTLGFYAAIIGISAVLCLVMGNYGLELWREEWSLFGNVWGKVTIIYLKNIHTECIERSF